MGEKIDMIAISGGPCAGKSTFLAFVTEKLSDFGIKVFLIPEVATILINSGFDPRVFKGKEELLKIQEGIFNTQLNFEREWSELALKLTNNLGNRQKVVIICDRGIMDIKAYLPPQCADYFETLAKNKGLSVADLMSNYKGVIHLVTAAEGAEQFYTLENNTARRETPEEARMTDRLIQNCWLGHSHLKVIGNESNFENKIKKALTAICRFLDIPAPIEIERKYLVGEIDMNILLAYNHKKIEIEQIYLNSEKKEEELRLRKRGIDGSFSYFLTKKIKTANPMVRFETERIISHYDFLAMSENADKSKSAIIKDRICFLHNNQYFELDFFKNPERMKKMIMLEIELTEQNDKVEIPGWIKVKKEVTGDPEYSNYKLASNI